MTVLSTIVALKLSRCSWLGSCHLDDADLRHQHHCFSGHVDGKHLHLAVDTLRLGDSRDDNSGILLASLSCLPLRQSADQAVAVVVVQQRALADLSPIFAKSGIATLRLDSS